MLFLNQFLLASIYIFSIIFLKPKSNRLQENSRDQTFELKPLFLKQDERETIESRRLN